jgi:hypothetical protein
MDETDAVFPRLLIASLPEVVPQQTYLEDGFLANLAILSPRYG